MASPTRMLVVEAKVASPLGVFLLPVTGRPSFERL